MSWRRPDPLTGIGPLRQLQIAIGSTPTYNFLRQPDIRPALMSLVTMDLSLDRHGRDFLNDVELFCNLKELGLLWEFPQEHSARVHPLNFPFLPNVQKIRLVFLSLGPGLLWADVFEFIGASITLAETTPALEELALVLNPSPPGERPGPIPFFNDPHYAEDLPALRWIRCYHQDARSDITLEDFTAYMGAVFPAPLKDGILTCHSRSDL
ncbi:hypothetical protein FB45DRAFT_1036516 [Roridomyces roridus]|uniref:Uncharacterized protein n=1 Tax=Roridomyces roridus TaxID=1738132 RepID=A0AAD7FAV0_9AGAR|nr:hypothetical protein FB45DRAFT_1036516 [Roridomyces roridus]